jgi:hypothetical protein
MDGCYRNWRIRIIHITRSNALNSDRLPFYWPGLRGCAGDYVEDTASYRTELTALKGLIREADTILATTTPLPENRTTAAREVLASALALANDLLKQTRLPAAAVLGSRGGWVVRRPPREAATIFASLPPSERLAPVVGRAKKPSNCQKVSACRAILHNSCSKKGANVLASIG